MPEPKNTENKKEETGLIVYKSRHGEEIKLSREIVKRYLVSGRAEYVTDQELMLYMGICKSRGLNPFNREVYLIKYTQNDPAATIVSIDYFRSRAKHQSDCAGWKTGIIVKTELGVLQWRDGCFIVKGEELLGGWFKGKPRNWTEEYSWSVPLAPYIKKTREGAITAFWREDNQPYMIAKVAESQGLRRLWPDEFQGLFVHEEIIDTTGTPVPADEEATKAKLPEPVRKINAKEQKRFAEVCANNKISTVEVATYISNRYGFKTLAEITTVELPELMTWAETGKPNPPPPPSGRVAEEAPKQPDNPQDPANAPEFELNPDDDIPADWPEGTPHGDNK